VHRVGNAILGESDPDPAPGVAVQKDDSGLFEGWLDAQEGRDGAHSSRWGMTIIWSVLAADDCAGALPGRRHSRR